MHVISDDLLAHAVPEGAKGKRRVRVYEPEDPELDATAVIVSELPDNPGPSVREAASTIAARVAASFRLYERPVFVEHRPPEDFEMVWFGRYRAQEIRRMGPHLLWDLEVGQPERRPLDRRGADRTTSVALRTGRAREP